MLIGNLEVARILADKREGSLASDGTAGVLGFFDGTAAVVVGVVTLAPVDRFNATSEVANQEAIAYSAAFQS